LPAACAGGAFRDTNTRMSRPDYDLGPAELEVMRALWDLGPGTVRQVLGWLHERGRQVAYTTVQTMLTRLEQKGYVASNKRGVAHVFRATLTRDKVSKSRLSALVDQLYDGAAGSLVLHLVKTQRLTPEEVAELQKLIDDLDPDRPQ
jgi:BlaI family penicillinase repressor